MKDVETRASWDAVSALAWRGSRAVCSTALVLG